MPDPVNERPHLPLTKTRDPEVRTWGNAIIRVLSNMFMEIGQRLNGSIHKDGEIAMEAPLVLGTFTMADLPDASDWPWAVVVVSDASAEEQFRYSDGTDWRTFVSSGGGGGGSVGTSDLQDNAVTFPKIQNIASNRILGRISGGTGNVEALTASAARSVMGLGTAALQDTGTGPTDVPKNSDLGSAAYAGADTDDLTEGATNLYFTDGRAQSAVIAQTAARVAVRI